jgi:hypothetical protein
MIAASVAEKVSIGPIGPVYSTPIPSWSPWTATPQSQWTETLRWYSVPIRQGEIFYRDSNDGKIQANGNYASSLASGGQRKNCYPERSTPRSTTGLRLRTYGPYRRFARFEQSALGVRMTATGR